MYAIRSYYDTPYGELWVSENAETELSEELTRKFTGAEYDQETGMYYLNNRYYDPNIAMFTRPDPAMDGLNHYGYCSANPIMYTDPTGLKTVYSVITSYSIHYTKLYELSR